MTMKFYTYIVDGERMGTEMSLRDAKASARALTSGSFEIQVDDVPVNAESIRALLSGQGGYSLSTDRREY